MAKYIENAILAKSKPIFTLKCELVLGKLSKMAENWHGVSLGDNKKTLCRIFFDFDFLPIFRGSKVEIFDFSTIFEI